MKKKSEDTMETLKKIKEERLAKQDKKKQEKILDKVAYDCYYDADTKKFMKVTMKYNPLTKEAEVTEVVVLADSMYRALFDMENLIKIKINKEIK